MTVKGNCLCGSVTVVLDKAPETQVACHCLDCQRTSGAAHTTNALVKDSDLHVSGPTGTYVSPAATGNPVTRTFCTKCGSAISHKSPAFGDATAVQTGIMLEHFQNVPFGVEIFVKDRWSVVKPIEGVPQKEID